MAGGTANRDGPAAEPGEWTLRDDEARRYVGRAVDATVALVESTLGPSGMEKLVETEDLQNRPETVRLADGARLLDAVERGDGFAHPVAALFVDAVDGMQTDLRDGTTTAMVLTGALLSEGLDLVDRGLAPNSVVVGYGVARSRAGAALDDLARPVGATDRDRLGDVAATTMTARLDPTVRREVADCVAAAVADLASGRDDGWIDTDDLKILGGRGLDPTVRDGLVLTRPDDADPAGRPLDGPIPDAGVAVMDGEIDFEDTASVLDGGDGVTLSSPEAARTYRDELARRRETAGGSLAEMGADVLVCMERLDEATARAVERAGVAVVDKATYPKEDVYRLARATGATVTTHFENLSAERLGRADRVTQRAVGDEVWTAFEGCPGPVFTLVVGGRTERETRARREAAADAVETTAVAVMDGQVIPGAGAGAAAVAAAVRAAATDLRGRGQLAVDAFADAIERVPATLARNAGHDPVGAVADLRAEHASGASTAGIDLESGGTTDAWAAGVVEPRRVFSQSVETACAVVERLLPVDAVLYPGVDLPGYEPRPERE